MKATTIVAGVLGLSMMTSGGWFAVIGWGLFAASIVVIVAQVTVIKRLKEELKFERGEREVLSQQVAELKKRVKEQQDELLKGSMERLDLSRKIEAMERERTRDRNHLVELAKSNEFLRKTLDELIARVKTLEDK